jgi:HAE1 family hydrophobic/amphiphilic exporter-1
VFSISIELPTGSGLAATQEVAELVAGDVRAHGPGVVSTFVTVGNGGRANLAQIQVNLEPSRRRAFSQQAAMSWIREHYAPLARGGVKLTLGEVGATAAATAARSSSTFAPGAWRNCSRPPTPSWPSCASTRGFVDIDSGHRGGQPQLAVIPDRAAAAELGVPVAAIARTVRALISRDKITDYKEDADLYDIRLVLPDQAQSDFPALSHLTVRSSTGELVPLSSLVRVERCVGPTEIIREARMRQITIFAGLDGIALGEASAKAIEIARRVAPPRSSSRWPAPAS